MSKRFKKQEYHRYKRVGKTDVWRKPRGHHSKMREHRKGNPPVVDAGYGSQTSTRFLHPSGLFDVVVRMEKDLETMDKKTQGVRIFGNLSIRNKVKLTEAAKKKGFKIFNPAKMKVKPKPKEKAKPEAKPEVKEKKPEAKAEEKKE
jgi:large subunit ribosomal protein L32e